jgi:hypothetical protein
MFPFSLLGRSAQNARAILDAEEILVTSVLEERASD